MHWVGWRLWQSHTGLPALASCHWLPLASGWPGRQPAGQLMYAGHQVSDSWTASHCRGAGTCGGKYRVLLCRSLGITAQPSGSHHTNPGLPCAEEGKRQQRQQEPIFPLCRPVGHYAFDSALRMLGHGQLTMELCTRSSHLPRKQTRSGGTIEGFEATRAAADPPHLQGADDVPQAAPSPPRAVSVSPGVEAGPAQQGAGPARVSDSPRRSRRRPPFRGRPLRGPPLAAESLNWPPSAPLTPLLQLQ